MQWLKKLNPFISRKRSSGIQVTDELVRFVAFDVKDDEISTHAFGEEFLSPGTVTDGKITNHTNLIHVLSSLKKKYQLDDVTVVLPEEQSFIFHTVVPYAEGGETPRVIQDHILAYLKLHSKLSARDLVCEYDILGVHNQNYEVQVTVTPKSVVESYRRVFEEAGLHVALIETGSHMVSKACLSSSEGSSCLLVDFGAKQTHVSVVSEGGVMESSTLPVGHDHITSVIERFLNVNTHDAQRIKNQYGMLRTHKDHNLLSEIIYELAPIRDFLDRQFIKWNTRDYKTAKQQAPIQKIVLHGEGAHFQGFAEHLALSTKIPVEHANVWEAHPEFLERVPHIPYEETHRYATAISAALRGAF